MSPDFTRYPNGHPGFPATKNLPECDLPALHLNGTGRETLLQGYAAAHKALSHLADSLVRIEFNARDYYVHGPFSFTEARDTRCAVFALVDEIGTYLEAHLAHLS